MTMFAMLSDVGLKPFPLAKMEPLPKGLKYRLSTDQTGSSRPFLLNLEIGQRAFVSISWNLKIKVT